MNLALKYIAAGCLNGLVCFSMLYTPPATAARGVPQQWQQQVLMVHEPRVEIEQMKERERHRAELVREQLATNRERSNGL